MNYIRKNEEAVSPVIGVILMVVITVIIAAVLAVFAFGMGSPTKAPQSSLKLESSPTTPGNIDLRHYGGEPLDWSRVTVTVEGTAGTVATPTGKFLAGGVISDFVTGTSSGETVRVLIVDTATQQLIMDSRINV